MLNHVHFAGIKSLLDVSVDLDRFTVLVGPNGCGKSTLLNQIEFLCSASAPPSTPSRHVLGWVGDRLLALGPYGSRTNGTKVEMRWEGTDQPGGTVRVQVPHHPGGTWEAVAEAVVEEGNLAQHLTAASQTGIRDRLDALLRDDFHWRSQRLRLSPDAISRQSPVDGRVLSPDGFGLATVLKDLASDDTETYARVQDDLQRVVPSFKKLRLEKSKDDKGKDTNVLWLEMLGAGRLPASEVSDGTLVALAILTATHNRDLPNILLMDDLDHGLHLGAQFQMIKAIRAVMAVREDLQVICTTHSPILLDSFEVSEVRVMNLDKGGHTVVKPLADHPEIHRYRELLGTGELWASFGEDWVTKEAKGA